MDFKLYKKIPEVGDLVGLTEEIVQILKEEGLSSPFPQYYGQQLKILKISPGRAGGVNVDVLFRSMPLCKDELITLVSDGTIGGPTSEKMRSVIVFRSWTQTEDSIPEPRNNDGRQECFWCSGMKTSKRGGGMYDVCSKCGR